MLQRRIENCFDKMFLVFERMKKTWSKDKPAFSWIAQIIKAVKDNEQNISRSMAVVPSGWCSSSHKKYKGIEALSRQIVQSVEKKIS